MNNTKNSLMFRYWIGVVSLMLSCICKSHAAILQVPADYPTIQAAVDAAVDGDTIVLSRGVYQESVDFKGKGLTLRSDYLGDFPSSEDSVQTIVEGRQDGLPVLRVGTGVCRVSGITVRGGSSIGVYVTGGGNTAISSSRIIGNAGDGVQTYYAGILSLVDSEFSGNGQGAYFFATSV